MFGSWALFQFRQPWPTWLTWPYMWVGHCGMARVAALQACQVERVRQDNSPVILNDDSQAIDPLCYHVDVGIAKDRPW